MEAAGESWSRRFQPVGRASVPPPASRALSARDQGLVYRGDYMVNWSPSLQTAVSDLEVEYSEEDGKLYYFK